MAVSRPGGLESSELESPSPLLSLLELLELLLLLRSRLFFRLELELLRFRFLCLLGRSLRE